jgi:hypothetical protein
MCEQKMYSLGKPIRKVQSLTTGYETEFTSRLPPEGTFEGDVISQDQRKMGLADDKREYPHQIGGSRH